MNSWIRLDGSTDSVTQRTLVSMARRYLFIKEVVTTDRSNINSLPECQDLAIRRGQRLATAYAELDKALTVADPDLLKVLRYLRDSL